MPELKHVAIIMDGNGRWAKRRGLPRVVGHRQGVESVRAIVKKSQELGIKFLTLYTFSTENWQRPKKEVNTLMKMLEEMIIKETPELHKNNVRIHAIGRLDDLYSRARKALTDALALTKNNTGLVLTLCLSYGSRSEIVDATKRIIEQDREEHINLDAFDERKFAQFLYDPHLPEPELLIRTGAENRERISNFLLWQIAYTEIYFTKTLWPDFRDKEYSKAIEEFKRRERLFGRVS
ncbi:MAG: isoprenyl transferase [candidate division WOR-3 bacterium]|nr:MAG: isoprenyl transferase [candidate division WOR-3 bacterium]